MLLLILSCPFFGFICGSLFGRFLGSGIKYISIVNILISFICSSILFYDVLTIGSVYKIVLNSWVSSEFLLINWSFCFDSLTAVLLVVITFISLLVHLYSVEYMKEDPHLIRFLSYLSLFTFFMLILVTANNFLQMFVGWEGVGLSSYVLINFWFTRIQANKAAIKAMLINRVGDFFILLALFLIYFTFNSFDYDVIFGLAFIVAPLNFIFFNYEISILTLICFFLFLGAMGKSAQIGLHTWLPDAMEGPTPVSALIHAATMVTAGVFLLARCSFLFELSPTILNLVMFLGSVTAFFAATTGLFQNDIKKIIAYSTCSQLGYMIFACGLSNYNVGIFHLSNHAFFKALLFLGEGSIIHSLRDEQDLRRMGGLKNLLPFSYAIMLIGSLALVGFPFLSGFYSKDIILEVAFAKYTSMGHFCYFLGTFAAFFTAFYSTRLLFLVFLANSNGVRGSIINSHEAHFPMFLPLFLLGFLSIFVGFLTKEIFIGFGTDFWGGSLFILPNNYLLADIEFISLLYKLLPLLFTILGIITAYVLYSYNLNYYLQLKSLNIFKKIYTFLIKKWFFDRIYNQIVTQTILIFSYLITYQQFDRGLLEFTGPMYITKFLNKYIRILKLSQTGNIFQYLFIFLCIILISIYLCVFITFHSLVIYLILIIIIIQLLK